ncbi:MAG: hydrogen peroxide-inducible genes activator, partial [Acinetobacter sp.]
LPKIALNNNMIQGNDDIAVKAIDAAPSRTLALLTRKSTPLQSEVDVLFQILQKITAHLE